MKKNFYRQLLPVFILAWIVSLVGTGCVMLDEEISLSELSGQMGIAGDYSASALDSLAPITVIATLLLSVMETLYLWLRQLGRWPSSK